MAACGGGTSSRSLARAIEDRPDDYSGHQIHFVYAVPSGPTSASDRRDTDGTLSTSIVLLFSWLHQQEGAPLLAVDTYRGQPDITYVRLPRHDSAYQRLGPGAVASDVEHALPPQRRKLYAIYYDGTLPVAQADVCGVARSDAFAIAFIGQACFGRLDFIAAGFGDYNDLVFVMAHEIVHELGFVPDCAPHSTGTGHVDDSRKDLMYPVLGYEIPILDVHNDDYYRAHVAGCPDLSRSPYLAGPASLLDMKP